MKNVDVFDTDRTALGETPDGIDTVGLSYKAYEDPGVQFWKTMGPSMEDGNAPSPKEPVTQGLKYDNNKTPMDLLPPCAVSEFLSYSQEEPFSATGNPTRSLRSLFHFWSCGEDSFLTESLIYISLEVGPGSLSLDESRPILLMGISDVLGFGAKKYAAHNWANGIKISRNFAAACRHICKYMKGQVNDEESGLNHLFHAGCDIMFIYETLTFKNANEFDDRFKWEDK